MEQLSPGKLQEATRGPWQMYRLSKKTWNKVRSRQHKLIHFTKRKRDPSSYLASSIRVEGYEEEVRPVTKLRVLGVWVDPKMNWKEHTKIAVGKGNAAFDALSRISASTWGPCMRRTRLLYTAVIRPAI